MKSMNRSNIAQFTELLNQVGNLLIPRQQEKQQEVIRLLEDVAPHVSRIEREIQKKALKFNVFSALGVARKEVIQSRFLAHLLDPNKHHCQGAIFLDAFLTLIGLSKTSLEQTRRIRVATEHSAGERLGRMDIVLDCQPDWLIVIENKVDASEGEQQLSRYAEWLDKQQRYKLKQLVFLTPTGREAITGRNAHYLQLSYPALAEAFNALLNEIKTESVQIVVSQYITTCKLIGGMDMAAQDQQLLELLIKPENIKIALEIEQQVQLIRSQVIREFGEQVRKILQKKLELNDFEAIWKAESIFWNGDNTLNIEIRTLKHHIKPNYLVRAESVFYKSREGAIKWFRPQSVNKNQTNEILDTKQLTDKMIGDGCMGAENWWIGWKPLRDGKKGFVSTDIEDIVSCLEDNRTENHPLANAIADELWSMFITYHKDVEALDSFKQVANIP